MSRPTDLISRVPVAALHRHRIKPLSEDASGFSLGVSSIPPARILNDLAFMLGKQVHPVIIPEDEIEAFLKQFQERDVPARTSSGDKTQTNRLEVLVPKGSVVQQIDGIITKAIRQKVSDIHIEPYESTFRVRYRLDGMLHPEGTLSLLQKDALISRLKIMAGLDIAEKRRPQDGRIRFTYEAKTIDLRVSTLPTDFGEKIVLRILDKRSLDLDLQKLGFSAPALTVFQEAINQPYGMILVTGPTGSGKTTTLYAALNALNRSSINITTIEDPIEYNLAGINQTHVRSEIGFTFAQALRAFLRQDPNIIMVGEMRDKETVDIAIRAALTGHLVLSTLHTNDAPSTVVRLIDMGVPAFLVGASVKLVIAQRLVRRICEHCKMSYIPEAREVEKLRLRLAPTRLCRGKGCVYCNETGYLGRTALFEVMKVTEEIAGMISRRTTISEIREAVRKSGAATLRDAAVEKLIAGVTTTEEVLRETTI